MWTAEHKGSILGSPLSVHEVVGAQKRHAVGAEAAIPRTSCAVSPTRGLGAFDLPVAFTSDAAASHFEETSGAEPTHNLIEDASLTLDFVAILAVQEIFQRIQGEV